MNENSKREAGLLHAISRDNTEAFNSIFTTYYPKISYFLAGFLDSKEEAEDLAQDVFVRLWQNRANLLYVENFNAYLYRIAKNILFDYIERLQKIHYTDIPNSLEVLSTEALEELLFADELNDLINLTVEKMPAQRRKIFILSRREGLSNENIAKELGISKRTVEAHISAAISDIRKVLPLLLLFF